LNSSASLQKLDRLAEKVLSFSNAVNYLDASDVVSIAQRRCTLFELTFNIGELEPQAVPTLAVKNNLGLIPKLCYGKSVHWPLSHQSGLLTGEMMV